MSRTTAMGGRRSAATCLLVLCLAASAILHFAAQTFPRDAGRLGIPTDISAPNVALALVLGNKFENPSISDLQPAVFAQLKFLRLFGGDCGLYRAANERVLPHAAAFASEIRGPPQATHS